MQFKVNFTIGLPFKGARIGVDLLGQLYQTLVEVYVCLVILLTICNPLLLEADSRHSNLLLLYFHFLLICDTTVQIIKIVLQAQ